MGCYTSKFKYVQKYKDEIKYIQNKGVKNKIFTFNDFSKLYINLLQSHSYEFILDQNNDSFIHYFFVYLYYTFEGKPSLSRKIIDIASEKKWNEKLKLRSENLYTYSDLEFELNQNTELLLYFVGFVRSLGIRYIFLHKKYEMNSGQNKVVPLNIIKLKSITEVSLDTNQITD
jgi:hypothetical protein